MGKKIILLSGGLDSTLVLVKTHSRGDYYDVQPLFVNYGQYAKDKEKKAVREVCKRYISKSPVEIKVDLNSESSQIGSAWGRTIALVGLATMWAYTNGNDYDSILVGSHAGDISPDCTPGDFDTFLNCSLEIATKFGMKLNLPIRTYTTEEVGIELDKAGVPFDMLYNCYWDPPCGFKSERDSYRCPGCRRKKIAMLAAGITREELLEFPNGNLQPRTYQSPY